MKILVPIKRVVNHNVNIRVNSDDNKLVADLSVAVPGLTKKLVKATHI
jgi:electron transfer flavoprotein alpha/beta subunit